MTTKESVESDIVNRPRTESESSNHSNPDEMLPGQNILRPEKEDFIVKVNVASELKELRKRVEEIQHKKRLKEIKAKNEFERKAKKSVKSFVESDNLSQRPEQASVIKTKLRKARSLPVPTSKDIHSKQPSVQPQRKTSKKKSSKKLIIDGNVTLKVDNR